MKRILLSLLAIAMLVPGLSCANMPCAQAAPASAPMYMAGMAMPCDNCPPQKSQDKQPHNLMLMSDCAHTPLLNAGGQTALPALDHMHYDFIAAIDAPHAVTFAMLQTYSIRGPPYAAGFSPSPLYLSTLRLRI